MQKITQHLKTFSILKNHNTKPNLTMIIDYHKEGHSSPLKF